MIKELVYPSKIVYHVESDYSALAYFAVLGSIKGMIKINDINLNSLQGDKKILSILMDMGELFFIDKDYWLLNFNKVKDEYLKKAETYVYVDNDEIKGFISLLDKNYIGALFVRKEYRRQGIGRKLINFVKDKYDRLELNVYEKNVNATLFYVSLRI